ncbi:MAG TPA: RDD family protein [Tepidisphaeraceae bacterium]|nr:RDD family protein [Tepidisphaeraceae bacterium]
MLLARLKNPGRRSTSEPGVFSAARQSLYKSPACPDILASVVVFPMKRFALVVSALLLMLAQPASAAVRDVLARASNDRLWVARVVVENTPRGPVEQTIILVRPSGPGQQWKTLAVVPTRVTALASRSSQLVVLLSNGSWQSIWAPDGAATGQPLPANAQIRALGDDGETLWAVGLVKGGMPAATRAAATQPTTLPAAAAEPGALADADSLVLFQQQSGDWAPVAELPPDASLPLVGPTSDISLAIVAGRPYVAVGLTDGRIRTLMLQADGRWHGIGVITPETDETFVSFDLLDTENHPVLWVGSGKGAGRIYLDASEQRAIPMKWVGENAPDSTPAIAAGGGYLRLIALHGDKLYEQRYDLDGKAVGAAAELAVPATVSGSAVEYWINGVLIALLAFSVMATLYRRTLLRKRGGELNPPPPAPLALRAGAGLVDLLPLIAGVIVVSVHTDPSRDPRERLEDLPALITLGVAIAVYILHTTLVEVLTGRTVGKWLFGLTVVSVDGSPAGRGQILIRNVLRALDVLLFPLFLVLVSPLRQRSADIAAGTVVVRLEDVRKQAAATTDGPIDSAGPGPGGGTPNG